MSSVEPQFGEGGQTWDNNQNFLFWIGTQGWEVKNLLHGLAKKEMDIEIAISVRHW